MDAFSTCFAFVRVAVNHRHVMRKRNRCKIPEHIVTYWCLYFPSCYFIYYGSRDTVAEKEFDIITLMTLERVLVQRFKKKEMSEKK